MVSWKKWFLEKKVFKSKGVVKKLYERNEKEISLRSLSHFSKEKTIPRDCVNYNGSFKCSARFFYCNFSESLFIRKATRWRIWIGIRFWSRLCNKFLPKKNTLFRRRWNEDSWFSYPSVWVSLNHIFPQHNLNWNFFQTNYASTA